MGFFNDIGKKTSETTTKIARETKLKLKINENKGKIKEIYELIGKQVYENHVKENKETETLVNENCAKIDELSTEIEEARKEILTLNNKKICSKCFTEIEKTAAFCPKCGEKQEDEEPAKEVEVLSRGEEKKETVEENNKKEN